MYANPYSIGPKLIFRGFLLGSLLVIGCGIYLSRLITLPAYLESHNLNVEVLSVEITHIASSPTQTLDDKSEIKAHLNCEVSQRFPERVRQWCDAIMSASTKYNLPPDLIASVIWIESGGDPLAYSHSGAVGLMQVMPRDGLASQFQCVNGPCFANRPTIEQLEDPQFNIHYGTKLLANLIKRHGNYRDALKAYGPMQVGYTYADKVLSIFRKYEE
ncbi:MAG: transglycosylase SLT domain-containing protein [Anaerolineales bacterium]|nr:transglycosylase SLT domain-containing protein [Anaerolineales bacterium]